MDEVYFKLSGLDDDVLLPCLRQANFSINSFFVVTTSLDEGIPGSTDYFAVAQESGSALITDTVRSYEVNPVLVGSSIDYIIDNPFPALRPIGR